MNAETELGLHIVKQELDALTEFVKEFEIMEHRANNLSTQLLTSLMDTLAKQVVMRQASLDLMAELRRSKIALSESIDTMKDAILFYERNNKNG